MGTFGSRLREERVRNKLTQTAMAELCGVQPNAQVHYENGYRLPRVDYLLALSKIIDIAYLITGLRSAHPVSELTSDEHAILATLRKMPQEDIDGVSQLFKVLNRHVSPV